MKTDRYSLYIATTVICSVLYAIGAYATSYIESPWGIGQFRPAVVIPAVFTIVFGPWVGGIGAALGTFIQSIIRYGQPWLTLVSGTPANFLGFYLMGWLLHRKFSWTRFMAVSVVLLIIANFICALGVLMYFLLFGIFSLTLPIEFYLGFSIGLTLWWYITMLPFILLVTPILLRICAKVIPNLMPRDVLEASLKQEIPSKLFELVLVFSGISMIVVGLLTFLPQAEVLVVAYKAKPTVAKLILNGIRTMFLLTGGSCTVVGMSLRILAHYIKT